MAFQKICIGAAGALAVFLTAIPARADGAPLRLHAGEPAARHAPVVREPATEVAVTRAAAADAVPPGELPDAPDLDAIPFFAAGDNAFYLRADAGFGALAAGDALTANGRFNPGLSGPFIAGAGFGYRFGYLLRADVTAEYRSRADIHTADGVRARLSGATVLANLYADIGTWHGVTPYVGAGVGLGWNRLSGAGAFAADRDRTDFVWAVGGGFAIEVTPQVSVDIGYRYLHTGAVRSPALALRESGSHDVRVGLRWWFGRQASADLP